MNNILKDSLEYYCDSYSQEQECIHFYSQEQECIHLDSIHMSEIENDMNHTRS